MGTGRQWVSPVGRLPSLRQYEIAPREPALAPRITIQAIHIIKDPRISIVGIVMWPSRLPMMYEIKECLLETLAHSFRGCLSKQVESAKKAFACGAKQHRDVEPMCR